MDRAIDKSIVLSTAEIFVEAELFAAGLHPDFESCQHSSYSQSELRIYKYTFFSVLQNVLRKFMASPLLAQVNEKPIMKGWITKVKYLQLRYLPY
jgi:hypothetical protein